MMMWCLGFDNTKGSANNRSIFLIRVDIHLMNFVADKIDIQVKNRKYGILEKFEADRDAEYERFRGVHIQKIIQFLLESEFAFEDYLKTGLLLDHFPLHDFAERLNIWNYWKKVSSKLMVKTMLYLPSDASQLRPLTTLARYFGSNVSDFTRFLLIIV